MNEDTKAEAYHAAYHAALTVAGSAAVELASAVVAVDAARSYAVDSWNAATAAARALGIEPERRGDLNLVCATCLQPIVGPMVRTSTGRFMHYGGCDTPSL